MKNKAYIIGITLAATTLLLATACSNELPQDPGNGNGNDNPIGTPITLSATLPAGGTNPTDGTPRADTRLYNLDNGQSGIITNWDTGDAFRLYTGINPISSAGVISTQHAGKFTATNVPMGNSQQADFSGILTATDDDGKYTAYYPAARFPEDPQPGGTPPLISLTGQVQTWNNSMAHLAAYNFMKADITDGLAGKIQFNPLLTMLTFDLTLPDNFDGIPVELKIAMEGTGESKVFTDRLFSLNPNATELTLGLKNITPGSDKKLKAYMLVHPFTLYKTATLVISLTTTEGQVYTYRKEKPTEDKVYEAAKRYTATIAADKWQGPTTDPRFFTTAIAAGTGTQPDLKDGTNSTNSEANPYLIANAENLQWFQKQVNIGKEYHARLTTDIYVTANEWTPIGSSTYPFENGTFNGQDDAGVTHTIYGKLTMPASSSGAYFYYGFFGRARNIRISNLHIDADVVIPDLAYTGEGASVTVYAGGIISYISNGSHVQNCKYSGELTVAGITSTIATLGSVDIRVGGIVGCSSNSTADNPNTITNCTNTGTITGGIGTSVNTGGILGRGSSTTALHTCLNTGNVKANPAATHSTTYIGGLCGYLGGSLTPYDCCNHTGTIYDTNGQPADENRWVGDLMPDDITLQPCDKSHTQRK